LQKKVSCQGKKAKEKKENERIDFINFLYNLSPSVLADGTGYKWHLLAGE